MDKKDFSYFRKKLNKTQKQMAGLLGVSLKAVHSYEQGWRAIPPHIERQVYFLVSRFKPIRKERKPCWIMKNCPPEHKNNCPAWEFRAGKFCWFINGTVCEGKIQLNWKEKMKVCRSCEILTSLY